LAHDFTYGIKITPYHIQLGRIDGNHQNNTAVFPGRMKYLGRRIDVPTERLTLSLLQKIAAANGTDIDTFLGPRQRPEWDGDVQRRGLYEHIAMLLRVVRAYRALPSFDSRRRALRMMEAMAARAKGMHGTGL
jgi:hypothetical protein